jgi:acetyl-CoA carboxylase biotin carboxyl carrier protein
MNQKEIKELIEFLVEKDIAEFELERGDMKLHIKRGGTSIPLAPMVHVAPAVAAVPAVPMPAAPVASAPAATQPAASRTGEGVAAAAPAAPAADADLHVVKSPIVGTFYEAPSPGTPPFVKIGDSVQEGQVLCIIEAMKLMNEIEAEVSGVLAKAFVSNGNPVEYGTPLFGIRK